MIGVMQITLIFNYYLRISHPILSTTLITSEENDFALVAIASRTVNLLFRFTLCDQE